MKKLNKLKYFIAILFLLIAPQSVSQNNSPVLEFPEQGLDDLSAFAGYQTRFYRDSEENTVQISIDKNIGRIVNLWADAANESISFSLRGFGDNPVEVSFESINAKNSSEGKKRYLQYSLTVKSSNINIGLFLLGSMRVERDFRYSNRYNLPLNIDTVYIQTELVKLIYNLQKLPAEIQSKNLKILNAKSITDLKQRLMPKLEYYKISDEKGAIIKQAYFDDKNHLSLEFFVHDKNTSIEVDQNSLHIKNSAGKPITLNIKIGTDSPALTPLNQNEIFNEQFINYYRKAKSTYFDRLFKNKNLNERGEDSLLNFRRMDRQIKSLELLSSKEKLMAGLPNFATYFGRDMMMSALMMEPIWKVSMLENVIKSVLKKLRSDGNVSHEEGLIGQAIRENAAKYNSIVEEYFSSSDESKKDSLLLDAENILTNLNQTTENYRMIDDDFQLPVLVSHYLLHKEISDSQRLGFLQGKINEKGSLSILTLLLKNLNYIAKKTAAYINDPSVLNLVSFVKSGEGNWESASWRDSRAGYGNGRFAMDINVIWVPQALKSIKNILAFLKENGIAANEIIKLNPNIKGSLLEEFLNGSDKLTNAINLWQNAGKYFWTRISSEEADKKIEEKLAWLPEGNGKYWRNVLSQNLNHKQNIEFLTLSLDEKGNKINIENTDPATLVFLNNFTDEVLQGKIPADSLTNLIKVFTLPFPVGLFIDSLGLAVTNDTYASKEIWQTFKNDKYHSPYVVWGREMNLIFIGLSKQILSAYTEQENLKDQKLSSYAEKLKSILKKIHSAVEESGLKYNELWSYKIVDGKLLPFRYETTSDIQLWNTTNLSAEYLIKEIFH
jgi:hypothetical protein